MTPHVRPNSAPPAAQTPYLMSESPPSPSGPATLPDGEPNAATGFPHSPREILCLFTAGWLGGAGILMLFNPAAPLPARVVAAAQAVAATLWFIPRLRMAGFGAMLAVLALAIVRALIGGVSPGALVFYVAVVAYLAFEERRLGVG